MMIAPEKDCLKHTKHTWRWCSQWFVAFLVAGGISFTNSQTVKAGIITFTDAVGVQWEVSFLPPIDLQFTAHAPAAGNRNTIGTLTDKTIRTNLAPLTIHFLQLTEAPPETTDVNGLRLLLETQITNKSGSAWEAYRLELVDSSFPAPFNSEEEGSSHPVEAHFHVLNGATYAPFTAFNPRTSAGAAGGCPAPVAVDVSCNLLIRDGVDQVGLGDQLAIQNLLLHEREFSPAQMDGLSDPGRRFFDLIETPIPEPSTAFLLISGLFVLGGVTRRLHRSL